MKHLISACLFAIATGVPTQAHAQLLAEIQTSAGAMWFELDEQNTPATVANFAQLARQGWYVKKTFYRVVSGHVIQAGLNDDNHPDMVRYAVKGEFNGQFKHQRGCLGVARGESPDSGGPEIYICHADRPHLDGHYAVFGRLVAGGQVLDLIASAQVKEVWLDNPGGKPVAFHQPESPVQIYKVTLFRN